MVACKKVTSAVAGELHLRMEHRQVRDEIAARCLQISEPSVREVQRDMVLSEHGCTWLDGTHAHASSVASLAAEPCAGAASVTEASAEAMASMAISLVDSPGIMRLIITSSVP